MMVSSVFDISFQNDWNLHFTSYHECMWYCLYVFYCWNENVSSLYFELVPRYALIFLKMHSLCFCALRYCRKMLSVYLYCLTPLRNLYYRGENSQMGGSNLLSRNLRTTHTDPSTLTDLTADHYHPGGGTTQYQFWVKQLFLVWDLVFYRLHF